MRRQLRGMALITALGVGTFLVLVIAAVLVLAVTDYRWEGRRQQRIQAYWNARSGLEHERAEGQFPQGRDTLQLRRDDICERHQGADGTVTLTGHSGLARWQLQVSPADPQTLQEAP